jgi:hypothetical protein
MRLLPLTTSAFILTVSLSACAAGHDTPAARSMSIPAACRYLHLGPRGHFPSAAALRYVAAHVSPDGSGQTFSSAARRSASDLSAHSLTHWLRLGPDFAVVMNGCSR